MTEPIRVCADDLWVKVIEMLQENWAALEPAEDGCRVLFISDASQVFDELWFSAPAAAETALARNGFRRFRGAPDLQKFLRPPEPPFTEGTHPSGPIYSSCRYWR